MAARTHTPVSMEARQVDELPRGEGWQYEPKWDGFRCIALRNGERGRVCWAARARAWRAISPRSSRLLRTLTPHRFMLDGELVIPAGKALSFEALQMRLHPAESRIRGCPVETPAMLIAFDMLHGTGRRATFRRSLCANDGRRWRRFFAARRQAARIAPVALLPAKRAEARDGWRAPAAANSTASSPSVSTSLIARASGPCSRSRACARPTASSAAFATRPASAGRIAAARPLQRGRDCSTTSASPRRSATLSAPR